jgi:DNA polymerase-4
MSAAARTILHLDLDAFYASVEQLADPALRGRPVVVGGLGARGVVAAASYEARRFGIQSAMPMARARRACPNAVFLAPRPEAYAAASAQVMTILRSATPLVEPLALDEAFLDVSGARRRYGDGRGAAETIRGRVRAETGLTASVGVATTKLLAKLASDLSKPDGLVVVAPGSELEFMHPLGVERLWGVGPSTRAALARLGVATIGELAALPVPALVAALGEAAGRHLHDLAWNHDDRPVEPVHRAKSIGHEETFAVDHTDRAFLDREVVRIADRVAARLRMTGYVGRTVVLKVRFADFRTITRSRTLTDPTSLAADLAATARSLLAAVDLAPGVRLLGLSAQQLRAVDSVQTALPLDDGGHDAGTRRRRASLEASVDLVRERFGGNAVMPARLLRTPPDPRSDGR